MRDVVDFIRDFELFSMLPETSQKYLAEHMSLRQFNNDEPIVEFGDKSTHVHFIFEGSVKAGNTGANGQVIFFEQLEKGQYFGVAAAISDSPQPVEVRASEDCIIGMLEREAFIDAFTTESLLTQNLVSRMAFIINERLLMTTGQNILFAKNLVAFDIVRRAEQKDSARIPARDEWAAFLGLTRETLYRAVARLKEEKLIQADFEHDSIKILDRDGLKALSDF